MSPFVQSKLLRVVESRLVHPLGSTKAVEIDVQIIAATNKDIRRNVTEKSSGKTSSSGSESFS